MTGPGVNLVSRRDTYRWTVPHTISRDAANDSLGNGVHVRVRVRQISSVVGIINNYFLDIAMSIDGRSRKSNDDECRDDPEHDW